MEEQPQQNQNYNYISKTNKPSDSNNSKLIWLTLSTIIIIGLIITLYFILIKNSENNSEKIIAEKETSDEAQNIAEIRKCLEMEEFNLDCNMLFSSPDIEDKCRETKTLKDKCFHKIATIYIRLDLCWQIKDNDIKQNCEMEVNNIPINVPQDDDRFYPGYDAI